MYINVLTFKSPGREKCRGKDMCINVLTFQKSRGQEFA